MKKLLSTAILTVLMASAAIAGRQEYPEEYLGLPGDNLNLYAVMNLFQESETLEAFEKGLNDKDSRINNLDLNTDGYVDYITVSDFVNGDVHTIVLRSALDRNEYQDVAVFTVEKLRNGEVQIQLIGDEALYGRNYIVEPIYAETPNPGYRGRAVSRDNVTVVTTTYYEVAAWPVIRFIYAPYYSIWRSNWYWGYYPAYWSPWTPFYYHHYYGYHYNWYPHYYSHYRHWDHPRWNHYHDYYYGSVRAYSPNVSHRITQGTYRQTYSRPETRRDGEALYASTQGRRSSGAGPAAASGSDRRSSAAAGSRSAGSPAAVQNGEGRRSAGSPAAVQNGEGRRTTTSVQSRTDSRPAVSQGSENRRSTSGTVKSAPVSTGRSTSPAATSDQAASRRTIPTEQRTQSTVQRSSQPAATRSQSTEQRTQSTVQRAPSSSMESVSQRSSASASQRSSAPAARTQSTSSGRSSAPAARTQSTSSGRSSAPAARTQSSSSGRSSAPAARTQSSSSGRSSAPAARTQTSSSGRSSAPSQGKSSSKSESSKSSDSRSSRR